MPPKRKSLDYEWKKRTNRRSQDSHTSQIAGPSHAPFVVVQPSEAMQSTETESSTLRDNVRSSQIAGPSHAPYVIVQPSKMVAKKDQDGCTLDSQIAGPSHEPMVVVQPNEIFAGEAIIPPIVEIDQIVLNFDAELISALEEDWVEEVDTDLHLLQNPGFLRARPPRAHVRTYRSALVDTVEELAVHTLGDFTGRCRFCDAQYFPEEATNRDHVFTMCCKRGKVRLQPLGECPAFLHQLLTGQNRREKEYRCHIRQYNAAMAFASFSAEGLAQNTGAGPYNFQVHGQVHHMMAGAAQPPAGQPPKYNQLYFLDVDMANEIRLQRNDPCTPEIVTGIEEMLRNVNPFYQIHRNMREIMEEQTNQANMRNEPPPQVIMSIKVGINTDIRRYNLPVAVNEVAAVFVNTEPPTNVDINIYPRGQPVKRLNNLAASADPMIYPLLFPHGEPGFCVGQRHTVQDTTRCDVTYLQFYSYRLQIRGSFSTLHLSGKLFQQYCVDGFSKVEISRIWFVRNNQSKLRAEEYKGLLDHVQRLAQREDARVGKVVILPSSFYGSMRHRRKCYQDAIAIMRHFGKPDLFITFTCNPLWPEISSNLLEHQHASDRPDLVSRVFHCKLKSLMEDVHKRQIFGVVTAYVYSIEWQKRGLPHAHIVVTLEAADKATTPEQIDRMIRAEIPNRNEEPSLFEVVGKHMIHRTCGEGAPCWRNGQCRGNFPHVFIEKTDLNVNGYPLYRRRNNGVEIRINNRIYDNQHVVPYNPYLSKKYQAHINVENCSNMMSLKYLFKYINKGDDAATLQIDVSWDEPTQFLNCRYLSSPEACWRLFQYELVNKNIVVFQLGVHLPDMQQVMIRDNNIEEAIARTEAKHTHLQSFFETNMKHRDTSHIPQDNCTLRPCPLTILYVEFPQFYCWTNNQWKRRSKGGFNTIGRVYTVSPNQNELFYLRMLLHHVRGPTSFANLKTFEGVEQTSFKEMCLRLNLLEDDQEYKNCLMEAATWKMPRAIIMLYIHILVHCSPTDPKGLYDLVKMYFSRQFSAAVENENLIFIQEQLATFGKTCQQFGLPVPTALAVEAAPQFDPDSEARNGREGYAKLNNAQRVVVDAVLAAIASFETGETGTCKAFFVDGPGGSGKTFLYNVLMQIVRGQRKTALPVAWTGIAAILLKGGSTCHTLFKLPVPVIDGSVANIKVNTPGADKLLKSTLILWDEAPMAPKEALDTVDRLMRDLTANGDTPFGGKVFLFGGDFRQVLPVVRSGNRAAAVMSSIKSGTVWSQIKKYSLNVNMRAGPGEIQFQRWLLEIGEGRTPQITNMPEGCVRLPPQIVVPADGDLCASVFGQRLTPNILANRAILCPKNDGADLINKNMLSRIPGAIKSFFSVDKLEQEEGDEPPDFPMEFINSIKSSGLPPHELQLKPNVVVMLLRNLNPKIGLCNGTRLTVIQMHSNVLDCKILTGTHAGQRVFLPRITLSPSDGDMNYKLTRKQFPVKLSFGITINKAQGQTFDRIGLYLPRPVFSHGQLYVALSRVKRMQDLAIQVAKDPDLKVPKNDKNTYTMNIVYPEMLSD